MIDNFHFFLRFAFYFIASVVIIAAGMCLIVGAFIGIAGKP